MISVDETTTWSLHASSSVEEAEKAERSMQKTEDVEVWTHYKYCTVQYAEEQAGVPLK